MLGALTVGVVKFGYNYYFFYSHKSYWENKLENFTDSDDFLSDKYVRVLRKKGESGVVYVVGTEKLSQKSPLLVDNVISTINPQLVGVQFKPVPPDDKRTQIVNGTTAYDKLIIGNQVLCSKGRSWGESMKMAVESAEKNSIPVFFPTSYPSDVIRTIKLGLLRFKAFHSFVQSVKNVFSLEMKTPMDRLLEIEHKLLITDKALDLCFWLRRVLTENNSVVLVLENDMMEAVVKRWEYLEERSEEEKEKIHQKWLEQKEMEDKIFLTFHIEANKLDDLTKNLDHHMTSGLFKTRDRNVDLAKLFDPTLPERVREYLYQQYFPEEEDEEEDDKKETKEQTTTKTTSTN